MDLTRNNQSPFRTSLAELLQKKLDEKHQDVKGKSWYKSIKDNGNTVDEPTQTLETKEQQMAHVLERELVDNRDARGVVEDMPSVNEELFEQQILELDEVLEEANEVEELEEIEEMEEELEEVPVAEIVENIILLKDEITNKFEFELIDKSLRRISNDLVVTKILAEVDTNGNLIKSKSPDFSREEYPLQPHTARLIKKFTLADKFRYRAKTWEAFFAIRHDKTNPRLEVTVIKFLK